MLAVEDGPDESGTFGTRKTARNDAISMKDLVSPVGGNSAFLGYVCRR